MSRGNGQSVKLFSESEDSDYLNKLIAVDKNLVIARDEVQL
jgi:hypothetical protein